MAFSLKIVYFMRVSTAAQASIAGIRRGKGPTLGRVSVYTYRKVSRLVFTGDTARVEQLAVQQLFTIWSIHVDIAAVTHCD